MEESLGAIKEMQRRREEIRHVGLSGWRRRRSMRARKVLPIVSVQNQCNVADRDWEILWSIAKKSLGFYAMVADWRRQGIEVWHGAGSGVPRLTTRLFFRSRSPGSCSGRL